jgi:hypothetical protein
MNFMFFVNGHPKIIRSMWRWIPRVSRHGWPLKKGGSVWYLHIDWLCFGLQFDNEW